jgi:uncharacterized membrane protein
MFPTDFWTEFLFLLRWFHFLAGITWIGLLYYFNLVIVPFMKEIDPATRAKVVSKLIPKGLWWFRWAAFWTVAVGLTYHTRTALTPGEYADNVSHFHQVYWAWIVIVLVTFVIEAFFIRSMKQKGFVLFVAISVLLVAMCAVILMIHDAQGASWRIKSIALGGGMGIIMFMNVWMIIWPLQKKIIAATNAQEETGAVPPAEMGEWTRRVFLASRTSAWMSIPMLFFMAAASHFPISFGK